MAIKDRILSWFIRNIVIPKVEIIENPGFILIPATEEIKGLNIRELFISENLVAEIENNLHECDESYDSYIYSIGKKFGYFYSTLSLFPTISKKNKSQFLNFANFLVRLKY
ncbi:MAG: hypothetical protein QXM64_03115 [Candidatus Aenigmatarchaeota archaeon]